jgi:hypothetical protein
MVDTKSCGGASWPPELSVTCFLNTNSGALLLSSLPLNAGSHQAKLTQSPAKGPAKGEHDVSGRLEFLEGSSSSMVRLPFIPAVASGWVTQCRTQEGYRSLHLYGQTRAYIK